MSSFFSCSFMCFWLGCDISSIYKYIHWDMLSNSVCRNKLYISFFFFCLDDDVGFSLSLDQSGFNQGRFCPLRNSFNVSRHFWLWQLGTVYATGIQWAETEKLPNSPQCTGWPATNRKRWDAHRVGLKTYFRWWKQFLIRSKLRLEGRGRRKYKVFLGSLKSDNSTLASDLPAGRRSSLTDACLPPRSYFNNWIAQHGSLNRK